MTSLVIAVDLGGTQIRAALCDPEGRILKRVAILTEASRGQVVVLDRIAGAIAEVMSGTPRANIRGIGIGAPGPLNPTTGTVLGAPNLPGWDRVPLRDIMAERSGLPTFLGNDANLAALAEHTFGAGRGTRNLIYLTISTGIGSGMIVDGRLLLGRHGLAAEAGHMILVPDGPPCGLGHRGCLESLASGPAIARNVVSHIRTGEPSLVSEMVGGELARVGARVVNEAAQAGDQVAIDAFRQAGYYLGIGITNLLHLFNPEVIVLGGSVTKAGDLLFGSMHETLHRFAGAYYLQDLAIVEAALGDDVGLLGAAALAITELKEKDALD